VTRVTAGAFIDVPHQELVVRLHQRVGVVGRADRALAATSTASAGRGPGASPARTAGVASSAGEAGPRCRSGRGRPDSGAWYSADSAQQTFSGSQAGTVTASVPPGLSTRVSSASGRVVGDVLHDLGADDAVERVVGEGKRVPSRSPRRPRRLGGFGDLAGLAHGPEEVADVAELVEE
jgi:hypothetical protein